MKRKAKWIRIGEKVQFERTVQLFFNSNWNELTISVPIEKVRHFPNGRMVRVTIQDVERRG